MSPEQWVAGIFVLAKGEWYYCKLLMSRCSKSSCNCKNKKKKKPVVRAMVFFECRYNASTKSQFLFPESPPLCLFGSPKAAWLDRNNLCDHIHFGDLGHNVVALEKVKLVVFAGNQKIITAVSLYVV
jgi:hypothetical protein